MKQKEIEAAIKFLSSDQSDEYWACQIPCGLDDLMTKIIESFVEMTTDERTWLREKFANIPGSNVLLAYSERMASQAVREKGEKWIKYGLLAHAVENTYFDYRENIPILRLLSLTARRIGVNPVPLAESAAAYALPETAELLIAISKQEYPDAQSIDYRETKDADGKFIYKSIHSLPS
jgi:hypothetical protein